jgi:hypothetical protein
MIGISTSANFAVILISVIIIDLIVLFLIRYFPEFFGKDINEWYNTFGMNAVIADVLSITLGFLIAQYVYTTFILPSYGWSLPVFIGLLLAIQLIHDLFFYFAIIQPIPEGHNGMIDVFKSYANAGSYKILLVDSLMMIGSAFLASQLETASEGTKLIVGSLAVYAIPYILTTRNEYSKV